MAATYDIIAQAPAFELVPPNRLRRATEVTAQAKPSGIVFYLRFQRAAYTPGNVAVTMKTVAEGLNKAANVAGVVGINIEQDVTASNEIVEIAVTTVESTSGNSTGEIRELQTYLYLSTFAERVEKLRDKLDAIEGL